jgi:hypothetical protein
VHPTPGNPTQLALLPHTKEVFLGSFAKLQKITVSYVMSVRMEQLGSRAEWFFM